MERIRRSDSWMRRRAQTHPAKPIKSSPCNRIIRHYWVKSSLKANLTPLRTASKIFNSLRRQNILNSRLCRLTLAMPTIERHLLLDPLFSQIIGGRALLEPGKIVRIKHRIKILIKTQIAVLPITSYLIPRHYCSSHRGRKQGLTEDQAISSREPMCNN
jgi:hypothetical protein